MFLCFSNITFYWLVYFFKQGVADTLKKQVKEETHSRTVMQSRIASDTTDLAKQQVESKKKKVKVSKKAKELEEIANTTLAEVEVLRKQHADRVEVKTSSSSSVLKAGFI